MAEVIFDCVDKVYPNGFQALYDLNLEVRRLARCAVVDAGVSTYDTHFRPPEETARIHTGNLLNVLRTLHELVDDAELEAREPTVFDDEPETEFGFGRELFAVFRRNVGSAEEGACALLDAQPAAADTRTTARESEPAE